MLFTFITVIAGYSFLPLAKTLMRLMLMYFDYLLIQLSFQVLALLLIITTTTNKALRKSFGVTLPSACCPPTKFQLNATGSVGAFVLSLIHQLGANSSFSTRATWSVSGSEKSVLSAFPST